MTNKYLITTFEISLVDLDLLVNTKDKKQRRKIANKIMKEVSNG